MKQFAAFDIDGTLIRWQLYHAVVDKLASDGKLGINAQKKLGEARMHWKRREHSEAFKTYELALINIYESALPVLEPKLFDVMVKKVVKEYKDQVYTYTRDLIALLKERGYFLLAISGSHKELVEPIANYYGFDDSIGTNYSRSKGKFSGQKFLASKDKQAVLKALIKKHALTLKGSIAVGDSSSDAAMLKLVERPIAFNPDQKLLAIAQKQGWPVVIERKNVVYKLEKVSDRYILV